jgi:hypothetical protein
MGSKKYPFDLVLSKTAVGTTDDLVTDPVPDDRLYCIQHVVCEDETTYATELRLYKSEPERDFLIAEQDQLSAAVAYTYDEPFYLSPRQWLKARFTGATASDVLKVTLSGWYQMKPGLGEV